MAPTHRIFSSAVPQPSFGDWFQPAPPAFAPAAAPPGAAPPGAAHVPTTSTLARIEAEGYTGETHRVTTDDGYILALHRIVGKEGEGPATGPVVFMQHGLEDSSACWVLQGPTAPAFSLAENDYDVWLGNFRGNLYSREHVDPEKDPETGSGFWEFSWDEMAKFDLPAQLNHVLEETKRRKIYYVGHSMGTTTFLTMNSLDQSWADKVELAILLAPVAYVDHMQSAMKLFAPYCYQIQWMARGMGVGEFLPSSWTQEKMADAVGWSMGPLQYMLRTLMARVTGDDYYQLAPDMLPHITAQYPAGTSIYTVLQYAQGYKDKRFGGMDWGSNELNQLHHHDITPPLYDLKKVNTKIALFWGDNDWLAARVDVEKIANEERGVQNLVEDYKIPHQGWNHLDFLYAIDIDENQNQKMLELLRQYKID